MSYSVSHNGPASFPTQTDRCPLAQVSPNIFNEGHKDLKRKREPELGTAKSELGKPFVILEHSSTSQEKLLKLIPRFLIPRSCIPLACLDLEVDTDGRSGSRRFLAGGQALQTLSALTDSAEEPKVFIVESHSDHRLYAVEALQQDEYVLCRLSKGLTPKHFGNPVTKARRVSYEQNAVAAGHDEPWWKRISVDFRNNNIRSNIKDRSLFQSSRLSMKPPSCGTHQAKSNLELSAVPATVVKDEPSVGTEPITSIEAADVEPVPFTADTFDTLRTQYLETLYINKTSLAYFTKGPLTRARTAVQSTQQSEKLTELIEFLRTAILPLTASEKKYNEALPRIVEEIPVGITFDDAEGLLASQIRKSKKLKKVTKEGLYPGEEEYLAKWWLNREMVALQGGPDNTRAQRIRGALVEQRAREIHLQIILVLEVLALEATKIPETATSKDTGTAIAADVDKPPIQGERPKKPLNLLTLLDILIDRLCIWHSTSQDETKERGLEISSRSEDKSATHASDYDRLRDFCTEVIVPYYATRLPDLYPSICRKLGGPTVASPARPSTHKTAKTHSFPKPGATIQRALNTKSQRPLERAITDNKSASRRPTPSLTRSATDSALPRFKRELSEIALSTIPTTRPTLQHTKRREVDLTAASKATEAKLQKKAAIEKELQSAITALKRPNPRMAVKEIVEASDRRGALGLTSRKSKNPARNVLGQGVQVMATPKVNRRKDMYPNLPLPRTAHDSQRPNDYPDVIAPSSIPCIPSSSIKPPPVPTLHLSPSNDTIPTSIPRPKSSSAAFQPFNSLIASTPSYRPSKHSRLTPDHDEEDELSLPADSPALPPLSQEPFKRPLGLPRMRSFDASSPLKRPLGLSRLPSFETPRTPSRKAQPRRWAAPARGSVAGKQKEIEKELGASGAAIGQTVQAGDKSSGKEAEMAGGEEKEVDIYARLGWDDVDGLI